MYYEINVAKQNQSGDYIHHFATAKRSITNTGKLKAVVRDFMNKFPAPQNKITVTYYPEISTSMDAEKFLDKPHKLTKIK